ncbi:MAG: adenine phosphoribosyltransferase [Candidatus Omnitrophica bacterium]|nr:adenine phosphoribosyltransferase [Candidatus Omnitrophota bacterium]
MDRIKETIRTIPDFPKKGILFRDITPLLLDRRKFKYCIDRFAQAVKGKIDYVVSIESRGFIFGSALAYKLGVGFIPIRKEGKLPFRKHSAAYDLEYGQAVIEIHADAIQAKSRVLIIDDVLATGGTAAAAIKLIKKSGGVIAGVYFLAELPALGGRKRLKGYPVHSLIAYS